MSQNHDEEPELWHHTARGYGYYGCRDSCCTQAWGQYQAGRRQFYSANSIAQDDAAHGTNAAYTNYGCRCLACTEAHSEAVATWRAS